MCCKVAMGIVYIIVLFAECMSSALPTDTGCGETRDCVSCIKTHSWKANCRWCPLDLKCHAYGSLANPCKSYMDVTQASECVTQSNGVYDSNASYIYAFMSAAAYVDNPEACIDKVMPDQQFTVVYKIGIKCDFLFNYTDCFAYIAVSHRTKTILVAYRGTTSLKQLIDQILTVLTVPKQPFIAGGNVQKYFNEAFLKTYSCVKESVTQLITQYPDYKVVITGHSLGAALASMSSAALLYNSTISPAQLSLYSFGSPRVGDKDYAFMHGRLVTNSWRVVHYKDIVVHLPTCNLFSGCDVTNGLYHHGEEVYYGEDNMERGSAYRICRWGGGFRMQ